MNTDRGSKTTRPDAVCTIAIKGVADPYPCMGDPAFRVRFADGREYLSCIPHLGWCMAKEDLPAVVEALGSDENPEHARNRSAPDQDPPEE